MVCFGRSAAQILQNGPRQLRLLGCAACSPSGGPFLAAQQPKSSKTDLARLVRLAVLLALPVVVRFGRAAAQILQHAPRHLGLLGCLLWWSVLAAQQPKSSKTDLASLVCLAGLLALLWWSVLAAQQPKSSKTDLASLVCGLLGCAP